MPFSNNLWKIKVFIEFFLSPSFPPTQPWLKELVKVLQLPLPKHDPFLNIYKEFKKDNSPLEFIDPGSKGGYVQSTVKEVFIRTTKPPRDAYRLARLANFIQAKCILELGSAFGTTALMLKHINPQSHVIAVEGVPEIAAYIEKITKTFNYVIEVWNMLFKDAISYANEKALKCDFVFLDGHHEPRATDDYIHNIIPLLDDEAILVIDDIHYTPHMHKWWQSFFPSPFVTKITTWDAGILIKTQNFSERKKFYAKILL